MVLLDRIVLGAGQGERQALLTDSGRKGLRSRGCGPLPRHGHDYPRPLSPNLAETQVPDLE
jgi:hypothetical protein